MIHTTCPYCGTGCGLIAENDEASAWRLRGDPQHPANFGRLCSKGAALGQTLGLEGRLLQPQIRGREVGWDEALDAVADGLHGIIARHGPEAVAFYVSGQLLTEDYYVANKLMKGFIGAANIDTNSRLCMSSAVAGQQRAFGVDGVPCSYADIELADLVVLVGSNAAWTHPVVYQRLAAAKQARPGMKVVVIDPRRTATCEIADLHLALRPGSDGWLFNGLLYHLYRQDRLDLAYIEQHLEGFADTLAAARESAASLGEVARRCGLDEAELARFYQWFGDTHSAVTLFSQGINQSSSGVDKVNAILNVHLATGRIGKPGSGPFSLTGQPNAMGGREVGGLATQLAAHMGFGDAHAHALLSKFWQTDSLADKPGLKAVELFQAMDAGKVKAVWIMGTNPMVSLPDVNGMQRALQQCELVVVSDCVAETETTALAHILLPAAAWGEKGGTVTNSERRISRQRTFLPLPGEARPDWWIISQVAGRMGYAEAFDYDGPAAIFREHARLSGSGVPGERDFDIGALADLDDAGYEALQPVQWPLDRDSGRGSERLYADGRYYRPNGRARLWPIHPRGLAIECDAHYPLILNSGRSRDQWHTMTRTGKAPGLLQHSAEPYAEIHPQDAARHGIRSDTLVRIESRNGQMLARARLSEQQQLGSLFVPIHWSGPFARQARVDALVAPITDPISGQPEFKHTPARIAPAAMAWQGLLITRENIELPDTTYRVRIPAQGCTRFELADEQAVADWPAWARQYLGGRGEWLELADNGHGVYRAARLVEGRLAAVVFIGGDHMAPSRDWLVSLFTEPGLSGAARMGLLSGRMPGADSEPGPMVCACLGVSKRVIEQAVAQGLDTLEQITAQTRAGSNCGSCLPEVKQILRQGITCC